MLLKRKIIENQSHWGTTCRHIHITQGSSTLVILFPGKSYSCDRSLLYYATQSALEKGNDVLQLEYGYQAARTELESDQMDILVKECTEVIRQSNAYNYTNYTSISKSLGTVVAGGVFDQYKALPVRHLFLTPLDQTLPYITQSQGLLLYGTDDPMFSQISREKVKHLQQMETIVLPEANHSLESSNTEKSLQFLRQVVIQYNEFL
ncbi:Phosphoglycolate phosphatase [Paenibacillus nuruki]|uniref:Phosphoglycolate phosphatase n=1 Tax=Paenibacillus nuruki TaxID=1886670 RepID=A0A1E3L9T2_9BACL|nr:Phosphoglycolate phosphatase [Paenibacillus nuruki]